MARVGFNVDSWRAHSVQGLIGLQRHLASMVSREAAFTRLPWVHHSYGGCDCWADEILTANPSHLARLSQLCFVRMEDRFQRRNVEGHQARPTNARGSGPRRRSCDALHDLP
jgi:hypothetical protein